MEIFDKLRTEDGHNKVNLIQPLDNTALGVLDQGVPQVKLIQPDNINLKQKRI